MKLVEIGGKQGKQDEAIQLYEEAIANFKKVFGEEHHRVATLLNTLASLLQAQVREADFYV